MGVVAEGSSNHGHEVEPEEAVAPAPSAGGPALAEGPGAAPFAVAPAVASTSWLPGDAESRAHGTRVTILAEGGARCLGSILVTPAEESRFRAVSGLSEARLGRSIVLSDIAVDPSRPDVLPALLYLALRRGRIWERSTVVAHVTDAKSGGAEILGLEPIREARVSEGYLPAAQRLDLAIHRAYQAISPELQAFVARQFIPEAVETLELWTARFFKSSWFETIRRGELSRQQYISTLSNLHQFVRYTTRLIGRAVGVSDERPLRNHWLKHLQGEINHELLIEKDLAVLGADVEYVTKHMVPNLGTMQFMNTQESSIGFYSDPVMMMASPFVAEGFSARIDRPFVDALEANAKRWGIENPRHVTRFIASHVEYDGGGDGHWEMTRAVLDRYITSDTHLTRFLTIERLAMESFERSYSSYVDDLLIF